MKIFLSWSKPRSRAVAEALNDWLKRVIQAVKPFYSPEIEKGANWSKELDTALEGTRFGIICLTPDNLDSTWIHYEAGALSKTPDALIWTFLHGINHGNIPQPLGKFQHTVAEKEDVFKLLMSVNKRLSDVGGEPLDIEILRENFERYWPDLEGKLKVAEGVGDLVEKPREERAILLEILETVRNQQRIAKLTRDNIAHHSSSLSPQVWGLVIALQCGASLFPRRLSSKFTMSCAPDFPTWICMTQWRTDRLKLTLNLRNR